jgi:CrcB protein
MNLESILLVGAGGSLGAIARYLVSRGVDQLPLAASGFPFGVLAVNVAGCLIIGLLGGLASSHGMFSAGSGSRVFLFVGILGGFTTFSAFGYDTLMLARDGYVLLALGNVGLQIVLGLGAVWVGFKLTAW